MIKVKIGTELYDLPEDLTISVYQKIYKLGLEDFNWNKIISLVLDIDGSEIESAEKETIELIMAFIITLLNKREESRINDFEQMTFGNFVDLEVYLSLNYINHLEDMMKILSPYSKTAAKAMYVLEKWLEWRTFIYKQYKGLFETEDKIDEVKRPQTGNKMTVASSWYKIIVDLSNDDILKMEQIEDQPFRKVLNFMAYRKQQAKIQELEMKKRERQAKLKTTRR